LIRAGARLAAMVALGATATGCQIIAGLGDTTVQPPVTACDPTAAFGPATFVDGLNHYSDKTEHVHLSSDELTAYLSVAQTAWWDARIYRSVRTSRSDLFGIPQLQPDLRAAADQAELEISVTDDGLTAFFDGYTTNHATILYRIARATTAAPFSDASPLGISSSLNPAPVAPFATADGSALYYLVPSTPPVIYRSAVHGQTIGDGVPVPLPNGFNVTAPIVSNDELTLFFSSDTPAGVGSGDIWMATRQRTDQSFDMPVNLSTVNTLLSEFPQWISPDGCRLYLMRFSESTNGFNPINVYVAERPAP